MNRQQVGFAVCVLLLGTLWGVLGLSQTTTAAPQGAQPPFANSADQREEMVKELREIKALLKEQNALLAAGAKKADGNAR